MASWLGRYPYEVGFIADELKGLLRKDYSSAAAALVRKNGDALLTSMSEDDVSQAILFLEKTPSQRDNALRRLSDEDAALLVIRAAFMGLCAKKALEFVAGFEFVPGKSYRKAAGFAARAFWDDYTEPDLDDVVGDCIDLDDDDD